VLCLNTVAGCGAVLTAQDYPLRFVRECLSGYVHFMPSIDYISALAIQYATP
jgi:hypothetical protein